MDSNSSASTNKRRSHLMTCRKSYTSIIDRRNVARKSYECNRKKGSSEKKNRQLRRVPKDKETLPHGVEVDQGSSVGEAEEQLQIERITRQNELRTDSTTLINIE